MTASHALVMITVSIIITLGTQYYKKIKAEMETVEHKKLYSQLEKNCSE